MALCKYLGTWWRMCVARLPAGGLVGWRAGTGWAGSAILNQLPAAE